MAQAVTIRHGDSLTQILKAERGLQEHQIHSWRGKVSRMNPHISSLDRIYPGESILIPDSLAENIPEDWIWRNAFYKIPKPLRHPYHGATVIYFAQAGDTIDKVARYMFSKGPYRNLPASSKRALLIHNNPFLINHLRTNRIPLNKLVNITPAVLSVMEKKHWQLEQSPLKAILDRMPKDNRDMIKQVGPEPAVTMARMVAYLKSLGASVGADDMVKAAGYGVGGVSGHAAAGTLALGNVNALMRELYSEAIEKFGPKIVHSKSTNHLVRMQSYLKGHPKYAQLMRHMQELPRHIMPKAKLTPAGSRSSNAAARHFRKHISLPLKKWNNSYKYVGSAAKQLNGKISLFKSVARGATWYVPATLGIISVAAAAPEMHMRTLFEEGFGVLGGAAGTMLGSSVGLGIVLALGLGPFGMFVTVFICASAVGIIGMESFKKFGGKLYDYSVLLGEGRVYHSPEQMFECQSE